MTSKQATKIRLVKCPKCRGVLPELPDLLVYECGGCGTVLQAKIRRNDLKNTKLGETDIVHSSELEHVSEDKGCSSSMSQCVNLISEENFDLDDNKRNNPNEFGDCSRTQLEVLNVAKEVSSSAELTCHETVESSVVSGRNSAVDDNKRNNPNEFGDCSRNQLEVLNVAKEVSSSAELTCHETVESSVVSGRNSAVDDNKRNNPNEFGDCSRNQLEVLNVAKEVSSSAELTCHEIVESSVVSGRNSAVDENDRCSSNLGSLSTGNLETTCIRSPDTTADNPLVESTVSPSHEQLEQSQKSVVHGFDRVWSTDTLDTTELINPSSELSDALGDMSKSPTTRSAHAYDGSISSCDGTDDQVPDPHLQLNRRTFGAAGFVGVKESLERGKFPVDIMMGGNAEMQPQARNSFSSNKKHYTRKYSVCDPDEPLEPPRYGHQMRFDDDESARVPFYLRNSQAVFENGSPSSHWHDEFQCNSSFCSPDNPENPEQEKIKLLRMVYELQDQLDRTRITRVQANPKVPTGAAWKEKQNLTHYNHEAPGEERYHDLSYPRYPRRWQGENWPHQSRFSQIPFSGEATNRRVQFDDPYLHCYPLDCQCSVQLPPPIHCCNKGLCRVHLGHNCHSAHNSRPSTPESHMAFEVPLRGHYSKSDDQMQKQRYMDSHFSLRGRDARSDEQRHKDDGAKRFHLREKHHQVKRHFRPIAGGAPFVTCYHCLKPLQLPADFLLFKRRCHQLRCGACSKVLKFSLQSRNHILPFARGPIDPISREVDDNGHAVNRRNLASASDFNDCPYADPVSYSDDYPFRNSCSTEGERVSLAPPFRAFEGNADHRKMSSGSSFEPVEERKKMLFKQSLNRYKNPVNTSEAARPSSSNKFDMERRSSEIEELAPTTSSPLHRLMGYNSASDILKRSGAGTNLY